MIVEWKGNLQEALELSNKALALDPDDPDIVELNARLKRDLEKQVLHEESARAEKTIQEDALSEEAALRWSAFSESQRRLLCLMELYPTAHWSGLLPRIKNDEQQIRQLQEDWEWLLAHDACTQSEAEGFVHAVPALRPYVWTKGFLSWLVSEIARAQVRRKHNLWLPAATDLEDGQLAQLTPPQRDLVQQALMKHVAHVSLSGLEHCHLLFYRRIWKTLLIQWEMKAELVDLCEHFLTRLACMTRKELWACAYYATLLSDPAYRDIAEKRYKAYLEYGEEYGAYNNLSVVYLQKNRYQDALHMVEQALRIEPASEVSLNQKKAVELAIQREEERQRQRESEQRRLEEQREQQMKDLEAKVLANLNRVDSHKKRILQEFKNAPYYSNQRSFAKYLQMEEWSLKGHWKRLVEWGMIIEEGQNVSLHPLIIAYLEQGWPRTPHSSMQAQVVAPSSASLIKPVFDSLQEHTLYTVLRDMYPGLLVIPNMALSAMFHYKKMETILTREEMRYFMTGRVDMCLVRTASYMPLIAFEVDGPHHDQEDRQRKDALKNSILQKGGLGLIRLQIGDQSLSGQAMWEDDMRAKINQALYSRRSDPTWKEWSEELEAELEVNRFGKEDLEQE